MQTACNHPLLDRKEPMGVRLVIFMAMMMPVLSLESGGLR